MSAQASLNFITSSHPPGAVRETALCSHAHRARDRSVLQDTGGHSKQQVCF
ncbi:UNVERIFIED_CONTAM: hypothetical protein FKN15_069217 [Acipenser sinensis]